MDWNAPMNALWNYFHGSSNQDSQPTTNSSASSVGAMQKLLNGPAGTAVGALTNYKPVAEPVPKGEATVKFYPSKDYLEPTETNRGKPWAPLQMPVTSFTSLAKAHAEALDKDIIDPETGNYILSGAQREGRWKDYGVNEVKVNYKSPPPSHLRSMVANSDRVAADLKAAEKAEANAIRIGDVEGSLKHRNEKQRLEANLYMLDELLMKDDKWTGSQSHKELTRKAQVLGLPESTNQEIVRDKDTGKLVTKVDVYRPDYNTSQDERAKYLPFALANKIDELGGKAKGKAVYQAFIGGGRLAKVRANQQETFKDYITEHPKNKDSHYAYMKTMESFRRKK